MGKETVRLEIQTAMSYKELNVCADYSVVVIDGLVHITETSLNSLEIENKTVFATPLSSLDYINVL